VSFAEDIRKERERLGYTQTQFAKLLGVTRSAVARWESGERKPTGRQIPLGLDLAAMLLAKARKLPKAKVRRFGTHGPEPTKKTDGKKKGG